MVDRLRRNSGARRLPKEVELPGLDFFMTGCTIASSDAITRCLRIDLSLLFGTYRILRCENQRLCFLS